ncbi:MAG: DUF4405 domain-containing protein [Clostridia bacterium]|nr:DUF4405 domain-containing protein [Clostridia bacterium]
MKKLALKKRNIQLMLDIALTLGILTLYNKSLFGVRYHEIMGLTMIAAATVHVLMNLKTMLAMRRNFLRIPLNVKLCLAVDVLLIVSFTWEGINGIMISKNILTEISSKDPIFKQQHFFTGALSVILLGIHIGLHICRKRLPLKLAAALTVFSLVLGGFGAAQTSMVRWLSNPLPAQRQSAGNMAADHILEEAAQDNEEYSGEGAMNGEGRGKTGQGKGKNAGRFSAGHSGKSSTPWYEKLFTVLKFAGIMFTFTMGTYWSVRRKKAWA